MVIRYLKKSYDTFLLQPSYLKKNGSEDSSKWVQYDAMEDKNHILMMLLHKKGVLEVACGSRN